MLKYVHDLQSFIAEERLDVFHIKPFLIRRLHRQLHAVDRCSSVWAWTLLLLTESDPYGRGRVQKDGFVSWGRARSLSSQADCHSSSL